MATLINFDVDVGVTCIRSGWVGTRAKWEPETSRPAVTWETPFLREKLILDLVAVQMPNGEGFINCHQSINYNCSRSQNYFGANMGKTALSGYQSTAYATFTYLFFNVGVCKLSSLLQLFRSSNHWF